MATKRKAAAPRGKAGKTAGDKQTPKDTAKPEQGAQAPTQPQEQPAAAKPGKRLVEGLLLRQHGKAVEGEPERDNYAVTFAEGKANGRDPREIIEALAAAYPLCVFTWVVK